jgi:hypothetical protein
MSDEYEYEHDVEHWNQRHEFYGSIGQGISFWSSMETTIVEIAAHLLVPRHSDYDSLDVTG